MPVMNANRMAFCAVSIPAAVAVASAVQATRSASLISKVAFAALAFVAAEFALFFSAARVDTKDRTTQAYIRSVQQFAGEFWNDEPQGKLRLLIGLWLVPVFLIKESFQKSTPGSSD